MKNAAHNARHFFSHLDWDHNTLDGVTVFVSTMPAQLIV